MTNNPIQLNPTQPDFVGIFNALMTSLQAADTAATPTGWNNLAQSGTGTTIVRFLASIGAFSQGSIARALQENYLDTARSPSAIFRIMRMLGIHIVRDQPGIMTANLTRTDSVGAPITIPMASQFNIGSQSFYNTGTLTIPTSGSTISTTLTRGVVNTSNQTSNGNPRQFFIIGTPNAWDVSDIATWAIDSTGAVWSSKRDIGLWRSQSDDQVYFESTLPDGTVHCQFGDGTYGEVPPVGGLTFYYISLASSAATLSSPAVGIVGGVTGFPVNVTTTGLASPNVDHPPPEFYKTIGPGGPANHGRAVTRDDHRALALDYPGVVDALFQGQAEMNPSDIRWMNVIATTLLTTTLWTENDWLNFKQYFETIGIATTSFIRLDPKAVNVSITINVAIFQTASVSTVTTLVQTVINNYFAPSSTSLGFSFQPSDLILAISESATYLEAPGESGSLIDYINISSPLGPVNCAPTQYLKLASPPTINVSYTRRGINAASAGAIVGL